MTIYLFVLHFAYLSIFVMWEKKRVHATCIFFQAIVDENAEDHGRKGSPETTKKSDSKPDVVINMPVPEMHSVGGVLVHMPHVRFPLIK